MSEKEDIPSNLNYERVASIESKATQETYPNEPHDEEKQLDHDESYQVKLNLLEGLIGRNVNLNDSQLAELTGLKHKISDIHSKNDKYMLYYILAFGHKNQIINSVDDDNDDDVDENNNNDNNDEYRGVTLSKETLEKDAKIDAIYKKLKAAKLSVKPYRLKNNVYLWVGMTHEIEKNWAQERNIDLLVNVDIVKNKFGTKQIENEPKKSQTASLYNNVYCRYSKNAEEDIYKKYGKSKETVFDDRTRLSMIYECITADETKGGAGIDVNGCIESDQHPLKAIFPQKSDEKKREEIYEWLKAKTITKLFLAPLTKLKDYFGEEIGFYYVFIQFYTRWLIYPALIGSLFLIFQLSFGKIGVPSITFMPIMMIFWSTAFVRFWERTETEYRLKWGMISFAPITIPQKRGENKYDDVTGDDIKWVSPWNRFCRQLIALCMIFSFLAICTASIFAVLLISDNDPNNTYLKYILGVSTGFMIYIFKNGYKIFAKYINDWEYHLTQQDHQDSYIYKKFFFDFINSFASLFYLAFLRAFYLGNNYYIRYYNSVCNGSNEYMSYYSKYSTESPDITSPCNADDCVDILDDYHWNSVVTGYRLIPECHNDTSCCPTSIVDDGTMCQGICDSVDVQFDVNEAILHALRIQLATLFVTSLCLNFAEILFYRFLQSRRDSNEGWRKSFLYCCCCCCWRIKENSNENTFECRAEKETININTKIPPKARRVYLKLKKDTTDFIGEMIIQYGYVTLFVISLPIIPLIAIFGNIVEMKDVAFRLLVNRKRSNVKGSTGIGAWNDIMSFFSVISVLTNVALISWRTELAIVLFDEDTTKKWIFFMSICLCLALLRTCVKSFISNVSDEVKKGIKRQRVVQAALVLGDVVDINKPLKDDRQSQVKKSSIEYNDIANLKIVSKHPTRLTDDDEEENDEKQN